MEAHQRRKAHLRSMEAHLWQNLCSLEDLWKHGSPPLAVLPALEASKTSGSPLAFSHSHFSKSFGLIWCKGRIFLRWTSKGEWKPTFGRIFAPSSRPRSLEASQTGKAHLHSGSKPTFGSPGRIFEASKPCPAAKDLRSLPLYAFMQVYA